jgi:serine/threonine protein kinase
VKVEVWQTLSTARDFQGMCESALVSMIMLSHVIISTKQYVSADYVLSVFHQLSAALLYCHNGLTVGAEGSISGNSLDWNPVLHRDIKPGNSK